MVAFQPFLGLFLRLGATYFEFVPHPLLPKDKDAIFVVEGGEALIYQIRNMDTKDLYALKVLKPPYRAERIARITELLTQQVDLPGLSINPRLCLTQANYPELVRTFPELEYAIITPWIEAPTWVGLLLDQAASIHYTFEQARSLALATSTALWNLETRGLAHADIAGSNILLSPDRKQIQLLDLEGMYVPGIPAPKKLSQGTPGYQHRCLGPQGQWCPEGDRFAGAILLTEMLTWWEPRVRAQVANEAETLFGPDELQVMGSPCWQAVRDVLWSIHPDLLYLFDQAWASANLAECPDLATWSMTLFTTFL
ncbi:MAG: hypothetical protein ABI456_01060 [Ktedonobacteraceae bacterium]